MIDFFNTIILYVGEGPPRPDMEGQPLPDLNLPPTPPLPDLNLPPISSPEPEVHEPEEEVDLYNEKDPGQLERILEKQKQERYAFEVSTTRDKIFEERKQIVDDKLGENFDFRTKEKCLTEVNEKYLSFILEKKRDIRRALKNGLTQLSKPKPGYYSYDFKIHDFIKKFLKGFELLFL